MAKHNQMELIAHPLSQKLANEIFYKCGFWMFSSFFLIYSVFLVLFTFIAIRIDNPLVYYNATHIDYDNGLCENVLRAIQNISLHGWGMKTSTDHYMKCIFNSFAILLIIKNLCMTIGFVQIDKTKLFTIILELGSIVLGFLFINDYDNQKNILMRCPTQWQYGTFGIFLGYIGLLYYIQYIPIIGIYFIMLKIIIVRFILFLPVLICLIVGFAIAFYMLFPNQLWFNNFGSRALSQIGKT